MSTFKAHKNSTADGMITARKKQTHKTQYLKIFTLFSENCLKKKKQIFENSLTS
jgi:hypothetical protein